MTAVDFWRAVLLCQLGIAALITAMLSSTTSLSLLCEFAVVLGVFWCVPAVLFICAPALSYQRGLPTTRLLSDWAYFARAVLLETVWFTQAAFAMSFEREGPKVRRPAAPLRLQPVLLIHGITCNRKIWNPLIRRLRREGIEPIRAINLEPATGDIEWHAAAVVRELAALHRQANGAPVSIIGHSMGGLVARAALRVAGPRIIRQLVTVGSPHHGTRVAAYFKAEPARQMRPGSAWLTALNAAQEGRFEVPVASIYSLEDWLIRPTCSAALKGAQLYEFRGVGHLGLLRERRSINCIVNALRPG